MRRQGRQPGRARPAGVKLDKTDPTTTVDRAARGHQRDDGRAVVRRRRRALRRQRLECRLDDGDYAACESPLRVSDLADGAHTFACAPSTSPTTWTRRRRPTPGPSTPSRRTPASPVARAAPSSKSADFTYHGDTLGGTAIAGYECRLDDAAWGACADLHRTRGRRAPLPGPRDRRRGQRRRHARDRTWTVDTTAPRHRIDSGPDALTSSRGATFTYSGERRHRYECRLDDGDWARAATPTPAWPTASTASRPAPSTPPATPTTRRQRTPGPSTRSRRQTTIGSGPDSARRVRARRRSPTAAATAYECRLDDGDWGACRDTYADLADGEHRLQVRAIDAAGNADDSPAATPGRSTRPRRNHDRLRPRRRHRVALGVVHLRRRRELRVPARRRRLGRVPAGYTDLDGGRAPLPGPRDSTPPATPTSSPADHTWTIDLTAPTTTIADKPRARDWTDHGALPPDGGRRRRLHRRRLRVPPRRGAFAPCEAETECATSPRATHTFEARAADRSATSRARPSPTRGRSRLLFAVDDEATTREDTPVTIDVGANDVRPGPVTIAADAASAQGGTVTRRGRHDVAYAPPAGFNGTDTFRYAPRTRATPCGAPSPCGSSRRRPGRGPGRGRDRRRRGLRALPRAVGATAGARFAVADLATRSCSAPRRRSSRTGR